MLRIRKEQMLVFEQSQTDRFARQIVTQLQWYFPARVEKMPVNDLERQVTDAIEYADSLGIDDDRAVELYASVAVLVDSNIHQNARFMTIASQEYQTWFQRMKRLYEEFI